MAWRRSNTTRAAIQAIEKPEVNVAMPRKMKTPTMASGNRMISRSLAALKPLSISVFSSHGATGSVAAVATMPRMAMPKTRQYGLTQVSSRR